MPSRTPRPHIASCAGIYRLARHWLNPGAIRARARVLRPQSQFALPPNHGHDRAALPLRSHLDGGLARGVARLSRQNPLQATRLQLLIAAALIAAIFTRYDGWLISLLVWSGIGIALLRRGRLRYSPYFWLASVAVVAAPLLWFVYNSVCFGDWLYFARGPYSAKAIEMRTATSGAWPPHPGWHNPWVALLFYLKVSELDAVLAPNGAVSGAIWFSRSPRSVPPPHGSRKKPRRTAALWPGRCSSGCPCLFTCGRLPTARSPSSFPRGGPSPSTTRATDSNCCPPSLSVLVSRPALPSVLSLAGRDPGSCNSCPKSPSLCSLFSRESMLRACCTSNLSSTRKAPPTSTPACPTTKPFHRSFKTCSANFPAALC